MIEQILEKGTVMEQEVSHRCGAVEGPSPCKLTIMTVQGSRWRQERQQRPTRQSLEARPVDTVSDQEGINNEVMN